MISRPAIHRELRISSNYACLLRYKVRNGIGISIEKKLQLLQRSGWRQSDIQYSRKDLVEAVRLAMRSGSRAREQGPEYLVEKFLMVRS